MTEDDVVRLMTARVKASGGTVKAWCQQHGINPTLFSHVFHGREKPTASLLRALGLRRVVSYEKVRR